VQVETFRFLKARPQHGFCFGNFCPVLTSRSRRYLQHFTYCVVKIRQLIKIAQKPIPVPEMRVELLVRGSTTSVRRIQMPLPHQIGLVAQFFENFWHQRHASGQRAVLTCYDRSTLQTRPDGVVPSEKNRPGWGTRRLGVEFAQDDAVVAQSFYIRRGDLIGVSQAYVIWFLWTKPWQKF
jgi:hypothetical protein